MSEQDDKTMGMLCHLLAIFTWFVGPLIIWLIKREDSQFVDQNGKNVLNFTILVTIAYIAVTILAVVLGILVPLLAVLIGMLAWIIGIVALVFYILGSVKSYGGEVYQYPISLPIIK